MYDFSNKKTVNGIHYTRYIMSWIKAGGPAYFTKQSKFAAWLRSQDLPEDEIDDICELADCGKLELEMSVEAWLKFINE